MHSDSNNYLPPVIYIANSPEQVINYRWDSNAERLHKGVAVLEPQAIMDLCKDNDRLALPYDLTPGGVLIRHPYNQGYLFATDAEKYLWESAEGLFLAAQRLGATQILYRNEKTRQFNREIDSNNGVSYKAVESNLDVKYKLTEEFRYKIREKREYSPMQSFTESDFEAAKSFARERGLLLSPDIRSLFDSRDPKSGNPMNKKTVWVEITSSLNEVLDIAFTLNVMPTFKLSSNTKIVTSQKLVLEIEWEIVF